MIPEPVSGLRPDTPPENRSRGGPLFAQRSRVADRIHSIADVKIALEHVGRRTARFSRRWPLKVARRRGERLTSRGHLSRVDPKERRRYPFEPLCHGQSHQYWQPLLRSSADWWRYSPNRWSSHLCGWMLTWGRRSPSGLEMSFSDSSTVIISPDGTRLVYFASLAGGPQRLFTRRFDQPKAEALLGTEGVTCAFFSPDGHWVGFGAGNKLKKISAEGGAVVPLADVSAHGASWGDDGNIVVDVPQGQSIVLLPSNRTAATPITAVASGEMVHVRTPQILPGGKAVLVTVFRGFPDIDTETIEVISLADRHWKTVVRGGNSPHYVTSSNGASFLLYGNRGTLFAIPFDLNRLETRGTPVPVLEGVAYESLGGFASL